MKKLVKYLNDAFYFMIAAFSNYKANFEIKVVQKRFKYYSIHGIYPSYKKNQKAIFVITHIVTNLTSLTEEQIELKVARLAATIDGILEYQSHMHCRIKLLTLEGYHLYHGLPDYQKKLVEVEIVDELRPDYVEYDAYDVFVKYKDEFDYFVFLEDDIIINDSYFIDKIEMFNNNFPNLDHVLLPHRYEMYKGKKYLADQICFFPDEKSHFKMLTGSVIEVNGYKFSEFENPHAGFYCLNKKQLEKWIKSGNRWKDKCVAYGPMETAATFFLYENFKIYNPHPDNINFFEIKHYGDKYSKKLYEEQLKKAEKEIAEMK